MLVQAEKVFVTACPLSELVWLPRKGLGLICTDPSSGENKTSLWWNTESFNVTLSPYGCDTVGDDCGHGTPGEGTLSLTQLVPNSSNKNNMNVTSPRKMVPESIGTNGQDLLSPEEMGGFQGTIEVSTTNMQSENKEAGTSSCANSQRNDNIVDSAENHVNKASIHGDSNDQACGSSSNLGKYRIYTEKIDVDLNEITGGIAPQNVDLNEITGGIAPQSASRFEDQNIQCSQKVDAVNNQYFDPTLGDNSHAEKSLNNDNDITEKQSSPLLAYFHHLAGQRSVAKPSLDFNSISSFKQSSFVRHLSVHQGRVAGLGGDKLSDNLENDIQKSLAKNKCIAIEPSSRKVESITNRRKGKETVVSESLGISRKTGNSHDSVGSSNSRKFSTAKRARSFEPENELLLNKKLKKLDQGNIASTSIFVQDSPFLNWISGVAKGFSSSVPTEIASSLSEKPAGISVRNSNSHIFLDGKRIGYKNVGFQSFVQTLYGCGSKIQQSLLENHVGGQENNDSQEFHVQTSPSFAVNAVVHNAKDLKLHQPIPLSSFKPSQYDVGKCSSTVPNDSSSNLLQDVQKNIRGHHDACNGMSSSFSSMKASKHPMNEDFPEPNSLIIYKPTLLTGENDFRKNSWIARLYPKASSVAYSARSNPVISQPQNEESIHVENKGKKDALENLQTSSPACSSFSSKEKDNDQKFKSKLNPILPSQRLKKMEPMASLCAKRLDAFRHLKTSGVVEDVLFSTLTCFFCGQTGHSLMECLEMKDSELESFQKNIISYPKTEKFSSLCIRCFQLSHWAIACPLLSKKANHSQKGSACHLTQVNEKEVQQIPAKHTLSVDYPWEGIHNNEPLIAGNVQNDQRVLEKRASSPGQTNKYSSAEQKFIVKNMVMYSGSATVLGSEVIPLCNIMKREARDEQVRIFEGIRKLHLTRADLFRSVKSHISLEGFFLRVRLGSHEGNIVESGYHVACICGEALEKSDGGSVNHISVRVVGFKCLIDCRFVSNNDFLEDELNAWWSATTKNGGELPSEEEISRKVQEREKFKL